MKFIKEKPTLISLMLILFGYSLVVAQELPAVTRITLREIAHELLNSIGDSTSRVLPIVDSLSQYKVAFENDFSFDPEKLISIVSKHSKESELSDYIVEVHGSQDGQVVYSFYTNKVDDVNQVACKGRVLPNDCYTFLFIPYRENSIEVDSLNEDVNPNIWIKMFIIGLVAVSGLGVNRWGFKVNTQEQSTLPNIGYSYFDYNKMKVYYNDKTISLSDKENELMQVLFHAKNKLILRSELLDRVWDDEGSYIGRTLDVYISKLRKKLSNDSSLKIINVRGKGYKLTEDVSV